MGRGWERNSMVDLIYIHIYILIHLSTCFQGILALSLEKIEVSDRLRWLRQPVFCCPFALPGGKILGN